MTDTAFLAGATSPLGQKHAVPYQAEGPGPVPGFDVSKPTSPACTTTG